MCTTNTVDNLHLLLTDFLSSTSSLPITTSLHVPMTTCPFKLISSPTKVHISTDLPSNSKYKHTISDSTQSPTEESSSSREDTNQNSIAIHTVAILGLALGILIIAVLLAVVGVVIVCTRSKKHGSSLMNEERSGQIQISNEPTLKGTVLCMHVVFEIHRYSMYICVLCNIHVHVCRVSNKGQPCL